VASVTDSGSTVIRLAIVNDYEIVVAGVARMLAGHRHRIQVMGLDLTRDDLRGIDVLLYDTFGPTQNSLHHLADLVRRSHVPVVVYTWKLSPALSAESMARGARGYLSKAMTAEQLVDAIEAVQRGELVVSPEVVPAEPLWAGDWPGRELAGLTARESEMLTMIVAGLSNREIAESSYLSINSVKTYISGAYRKIGVERRSQAVVWGLGNGFRTEPAVSAETENPLPGSRS
jgi:NarL family two-component system response regulator LiaR